MSAPLPLDRSTHAFKTSRACVFQIRRWMLLRCRLGDGHNHLNRFHLNEVVLLVRKQVVLTRSKQNTTNPSTMSTGNPLVARIRYRNVSDAMYFLTIVNFLTGCVFPNLEQIRFHRFQTSVCTVMTKTERNAYSNLQHTVPIHVTHRERNRLCLHLNHTRHDSRVDVQHFFKHTVVLMLRARHVVPRKEWKKRPNVVLETVINNTLSKPVPKRAWKTTKTTSIGEHANFRVSRSVQTWYDSSNDILDESVAMCDASSTTMVVGPRFCKDEEKTTFCTDLNLSP